MAETINTPATGEVVTTVAGNNTPSPGTAGLETQVPGRAATVSDAASATGGIAGGNFVEPDIDDELFRFNSDDTPLMQLMLKAKKVRVDSPVVEHFMVDEPKSSFATNDDVSASSNLYSVLKLEVDDQQIARPYTTLMVDVDGYDPTGQNTTPGRPLQVIVTGYDQSTGNPIIRAFNGPKTNTTDEYSKVPAIPAGTKITILSNALYETQKEVDPDLIVPTPEEVFLQKRGMNQIISDYFESQKKRIPFSKAIIAEQAIANFKVKCNRSLWAGRKGKMKIDTKLGPQDMYTSEGVRWMFKKEVMHTGAWTVEQLIGLAKMFFTGEDVPKTAILLAGKNLLEQLQCIDYTKHPEITISSKVNPVGWVVTNIHTVFGDIEIKREPTLDKLGWSNSGALLGENRLVHYYRTPEHKFEERVEGEEATRNGILRWDALALKGSCHIWIDGEGDSDDNGGNFVFWDDDDAPSGTDLVEGRIYYLLQDVSGINTDAKAGQMWKAATVTPGASQSDPPTVTWEEYTGGITA